MHLIQIKCNNRLIYLANKTIDHAKYFMYARLLEDYTPNRQTPIKKELAV